MRPDETALSGSISRPTQSTIPTRSRFSIGLLARPESLHPASSQASPAWFCGSPPSPAITARPVVSTTPEQTTSQQPLTQYSLSSRYRFKGVSIGQRFTAELRYQESLNLRLHITVRPRIPAREGIRFPVRKRQWAIEGFA